MTKGLFSLLIFLILTFLDSESFAQVRRAQAPQDQIVTVKTALGIATIIQVEARPTSVVVGDLDSFKVEYLDEAITIKPLSYGARSNLYIYTEWRRYNVRLVSVPKEEADFVVYLESAVRAKSEAQALPKMQDSVTVAWIPLNRQLTNEELIFRTKQKLVSPDGLLWIDFEVTATRAGKFDPAWLWITQGGKTRPIHNLILSSLELQPGRPVQGVLQIRRADLNSSESFRIELRRKRTSYMTLHEAESWKK